MQETKIPQALKDFKNKLEEKLGTRVEKIILFGSRARGDFHKKSDIDVLIVMHEKNVELENSVHDTIIQILLKYGIYLSAVVFSSKEYVRLNNIPTIFMQKIAAEGVLI